MSYSNLIRLGGLAAMVGGVIYAGASILAAPFPANLLTRIWEVFYVLFLLSAMAVIVALHLLQRERYGRKGALASASAFVGGALIPGSHISLYLPNYGGGVLGIATDALLLSMGMLVATIGTIALGIFTLKAGVLPRWCGWALIAGNPLLGVSSSSSSGWTYSTDPGLWQCLGLWWALLSSKRRDDGSSDLQECGKAATFAEFIFYAVG